MEKQQLTVLALLDFSNAFNTVDFDILLEILRCLNISPAVIDWFRSYLHGRRQRVQIQEQCSNWSALKTGVPQGGVLSPLLFAIFINTVCPHITSSYHLYADDLQVYTQSPLHRLHDAISALNSDLDRILLWSESFGLKVNPIKTQAIIIGSSRLIAKISWSHLPKLILDGVHIPYSDRVRNLGIILDSNFSWTPQINEVSRKIFAGVGSLRRIRNFLPNATKAKLAETLLLPILDYADICYTDLTEEQLNKLERLQNVCIRFIFGLRKYDHISEFRAQLKWLPIRFRRNVHILSALFCVLFDPYTPSYLKEKFQYLHHQHLKLRSSKTLKLVTPLHFSSFYSKSFTVTAIRLWNSLPINVRKAKNVEIFKKLVKLHYATLAQ